MTAQQTTENGTCACIVYCPKGMNGRVVEAPIGIWFDKDFGDQLDEKKLNALRQEAEKAVNFTGYEAFRSEDGGLRIKATVMATNRRAFKRAADNLSLALWRHLRIRAPHQQLVSQELVHQLIS